ncbi:MAG: hypothetical protein Q9214_005669 [Letrouitia sp. 1 TL-2023]
MPRNAKKCGLGWNLEAALILHRKETVETTTVTGVVDVMTEETMGGEAGQEAQISDIEIVIFAITGIGRGNDMKTTITDQADEIDQETGMKIITTAQLKEITQGRGTETETETETEIADAHGIET